MLVVDKIKAVGRCEAELRHLRLVQHPALPVLDAVADLRRARIRQEVELALLALHRGGETGAAVQRVLLLQLLQPPLFLNAGPDHDGEDHGANDYEIDAHAASVVHDRGVIGVVQNGDGLADLIGAAAGVQLAGIGLPIHGILHRGEVNGAVVAAVFTQRHDGARGFHKALRAEKGEINPHRKGDHRQHRGEDFQLRSS